MNDDEAIALALAEAKAASARGEVPVGAVLVHNGTLLASNGNRIVELKDPTAHAEILVIRQAAVALRNERLNNAVLYVTLEPCAMCAGAIAMARIPRLVFAADDPKGGAVLHGARFFDLPTCHHKIEIARADAADAAVSAELLRGFFRARRAKPSEPA